jgi:hypothetical protein
MSVPYSVADRMQLLRSRAQRYNDLAEALHDRRAAAEVSGYGGLAMGRAALVT